MIHHWFHLLVLLYTSLCHSLRELWIFITVSNKETVDSCVSETIPSSVSTAVCLLKHRPWSPFLKDSHSRGYIYNPDPKWFLGSDKFGKKWCRVLILQIRKLGYRHQWWTAPCCPDRQWQSWDEKLGFYGLLLSKTVSNFIYFSWPWIIFHPFPHSRCFYHYVYWII